MSGVSGQVCSEPVKNPPFIIELVKTNPAQFRAGFLVWLVENIHVWHAFRREAEKVWIRGRRHYSARTLIEYLRHETALADNGADFKLNNDAAPDLSRLYRLAYPERADLFEVRGRTA